MEAEQRHIRISYRLQWGRVKTSINLTMQCCNSPFRINEMFLISATVVSNEESRGSASLSLPRTFFASRNLNSAQFSPKQLHGCSVDICPHQNQDVGHGGKS